MTKAQRHPLLAADIADVLRTTLDTFGVRQFYRYAEAIEDAIDQLTTHPNEGRVFEPQPRYRLFHIGRPGRRARHQIVYAVEDDGTVIVLRLLHDRMDVVRYIPRH